MIEYIDNYDVAVIGGGHAGVEAALASARLGMKTVMFSISLDCIANFMSTYYPENRLGVGKATYAK